LVMDHSIHEGLIQDKKWLAQGLTNKT